MRREFWANTNKHISPNNHAFIPPFDITVPSFIRVFLLLFLLRWPHTTPVIDQLPLLFGQLEKQSGRSIARVSGEKEKKVVCCMVALQSDATLCEKFKFPGFQILVRINQNLATSLQ